MFFGTLLDHSTVHCTSYHHYLSALKLKDSFFNSIITYWEHIAEAFLSKKYKIVLHFNVYKYLNFWNWLGNHMGHDLNAFVWLWRSSFCIYHKILQDKSLSQIDLFGLGFFWLVGWFIFYSSMKLSQGLLSLKYFNKAITSWLLEKCSYLTNSCFIYRLPVAWIQGIYFSCFVSSLVAFQIFEV